MDKNEASVTGTITSGSGAEKELETETPLLIPVIREELNVLIQQYITGIVRVKKLVGEREEVVDLPTSQTNFVVEKVPLNKAVSQPPPMREEGETTIFSVVEEVLVTTTQYVVKEEIRISRQHSHAPRRERFLLRTEELVIEREQIHSKEPLTKT